MQLPAAKQPCKTVLTGEHNGRRSFPTARTVTQSPLNRRPLSLSRIPPFGGRQICKEIQFLTTEFVREPIPAQSFIVHFACPINRFRATRSTAFCRICRSLTASAVKKNLYRYKDGTGSRRPNIRGFSVLGDAGVSPCYIGLDYQVAVMRSEMAPDTPLRKVPEMQNTPLCHNGNYPFIQA